MPPTDKFSDRVAAQLARLKQHLSGRRPVAVMRAPADGQRRPADGRQSDPSQQRILFVCMGNICRSPLAEGIARGLAQQQGLAARLVFDSAGTHGHLHSGSPPDRRAQRVAARHGYDLSKLRARPVIDADFDRFDRILVMDNANLAELKRRCPPDSQGKLGLFLDYADSLAEKDVPDPYYGTEDGFERVLELCEQAARGLLIRLTRDAAVSKVKTSE